MDEHPKRWQAVGEQVSARMEHLGLDQGALCARTGLTRETIRPVQTGRVIRHQPSRQTKVKIAKALWGEPDAIDRILAGQSPVSSVSPPPDRTLQEELAEIRARTERSEAKLDDLLRHLRGEAL